MGHQILRVHTSPNDHRAYRYLTLPNQLRVLLIEDHKTEKSAAALAVNADRYRVCHRCGSGGCGLCRCGC